jgi:hypothetical protein
LGRGKRRAKIARGLSPDPLSFLASFSFGMGFAFAAFGPEIAPLGLNFRGRKGGGFVARFWRFWFGGFRGPSCAVWACFGGCRWRRSGCRLVVCPGLGGRGWSGFVCRPARARAFVWSRFGRPALGVLVLGLLALLALPALLAWAWLWVCAWPARAGSLR